MFNEFSEQEYEHFIKMYDEEKLKRKYEEFKQLLLSDPARHQQFSKDVMRAEIYSEEMDAVSRAAMSKFPKWWKVVFFPEKYHDSCHYKLSVPLNFQIKYGTRVRKLCMWAFYITPIASFLLGAGISHLLSLIKF